MGTPCSHPSSAAGNDRDCEDSCDGFVCLRVGVLIGRSRCKAPLSGLYIRRAVHQEECEEWLARCQRMHRQTIIKFLYQGGPTFLMLTVRYFTQEPHGNGKGNSPAHGHCSPMGAYSTSTWHWNEEN